MTDFYQNTDSGQEPNKETEFLASVIANLPQGIIICNSKGEILLSNRQVNTLLGIKKVDGMVPFSGKTITSLIDKHLVNHTLDEINERLKRNGKDAVSYFIFKTKQRTIQAKVSPVLNSANFFQGFVLVLNDITRQSETDQKMETMLHSLAKNARSPIASIRAAIEAIKEFPGMAPDRQDKFKDIIYTESVALSRILNDLSENYTRLVGTKKLIVSISGVDLISTIARRAREKLNIEFNSKDVETDVQVKADRYALIMIILFLLSRLRDETGSSQFSCSVSMRDTIANIDIYWQGNAIDPEMVKGWEEQYPDVSGQIFPMTLKEAIDANHGALWSYASDDSSENPFLRIFIPGEIRTLKPADSMMVLPEAQFDFYDPDLFSKSGLDPELDNRLLTELNYTALIREINQAKNLRAIMGKHSQLPRLIHSMLTSGTKTKTITWLITTFSDAILEKIIGFALEEQGPPPVSFAFITLGSEGRQEQTLKTDQDNAIIFEDIQPGFGLTEEQVQQYFIDLSEKICLWLDRAGYDLCLGGIMAKNPTWCQPVTMWKSYFTKWIRTAEPESILHTTIFFDFRHAYGNKYLTEELRDHLGRTLDQQAVFLRFLTLNSLGFRPPIGFFGNFIVESEGDHKKCIDIKVAMTIIVDFARTYALKAGIKQTNTQSRLYQLYIKRVLSRIEFIEIEQAYNYLLQLRFMRQINAIIHEKTKPDNHINPKILSKIEQKTLKEVLKKMKLLQARMKMELVET